MGEVIERVCSGCGNPYPRTLEFWPPDKKKYDGLGYHCRECLRAANRASYQRYREARIARVDEWRAAHPDDARDYVRRSMAQRRASGEVAAYKRQWRQERPEVARSQDKRRRARKAGAQGRHTAAEWL